MGRKVMTYGGFDMIRTEDIELFQEAKQLGDYLVVVLAGDELGNFERTVEHRQIILEAVRFVDEVVVIRHEGQLKKIVKDYEIDIFMINRNLKGIQ